jgi:cobalt-zinc-cadmium efflux system protein
MPHDHHDHDHHPGALACGGDADEQTGARLAFAAALTFLIFLAEVVGGILTGSLALLSDAAHVFSDVFALGLSYGAHRLARRPASVKRTFGWHRAEVLAAVINGLTLVVIGVVIIREAYERFLHPAPIRVGPMLIVAVCGLVANGIVLLRLGGHNHTDLNVRGAYLHVLGDLLASVGVVIAGVVMRFTGFHLIDPILSVLIALAIIYSSARLLREGFHILLEGVPYGMDLEEVIAALRALPNVTDVHYVHVWSLCSNVHAMSAHLMTGPLDDETREALLTQADRMVGERFAIAETTFQVETTACEVNHVLHVSSHARANSRSAATR